MKLQNIFTAASVGTCCFLLLQCYQCNSPVAGNGSQTPNSVVGRLYQPDGKSPAAAVRVVIRPKMSLADTAGTGLGKRMTDSASVVTDNSGYFAFDSTLDTGTYVIEAASGNDAVLIDSVVVENKTTADTLAPDTLKPAGALKGIIHLSEGGDPQKVFVLAFGIDRFVRVEADGRFKFIELAEGRYDLRIISSLDNYGVLDTFGISINSADTTNLDTIRLPFTGIPTPKNVSIAYDTLRQIVTLTWSKADTALAKTYNIYRRNVGLNTVLARINTSPIADTVYRDSTGVQDSTYEYVVAAVNPANMEGTKSAVVSVKVVSGFTLVSLIGSNGTGPEQYQEPVSVTLFQNKIFIADRSGNKILVLDTSGSFLKSYSGFSQPEGVRVKNDNSFFVLEGASKIIKCVDTSGSIIFQFGGSGIDTGKFADPIVGWEMAIHPNSELYVTDMRNDRIQVFDSIGTFRRALPFASLPSALSILTPNLMAVGWNKNSSNEMISIVDTNGTTIREWPTSHRLHITSTENGNIIAAKYVTLQIYSQQGEFLGEFICDNTGNTNIRGISTDINGHIFVADGINVKIFRASGI